MAPPVGAWRRYPPNRHFNPFSAAAKRLNDGFTAQPTRPRLKPKTKKLASLGKLRGKMGKKGWMATGMIPVVAGLGTLLGSVLKPKSNKKQEGSGNTPWRVLKHQPFLLTSTSNGGPGWGRKIQQASTEELRALTDLIRNLYNGVIDRGVTGFDRLDTQRVQWGHPHPHGDQVALEKTYKRDSTNQWAENPLVRTSCSLSFIGETSPPFCVCWLESLDKMSEKYAKEMILVPKPPEGIATQAGGQGANDGMAQFWKRRLLVDELAHTPHVDKMMKIMNDMKESEGCALPPLGP